LGPTIDLLDISGTGDGRRELKFVAKGNDKGKRREVVFNATRPGKRGA